MPTLDPDAARPQEEEEQEEAAPSDEEVAAPRQEEAAPPPQEDDPASAPQEEDPASAPQEAAAVPGARGGRRWWRVAAIAAVGILLWTALAAWSASSPWGSAPDDDYHTAMIYCAAGEAECVRQGPRSGPCYAFNASVAGDCDIVGSATVPPTTGIRSGWYPPMYYAVAGLFIGDTVADTTRNVRLLNVSLTVILVIGSVALSRPGIRPAVAISWLVTSVPMGMFLFSSMNPNAWGVLGVAAMWGPLLTVLTTERFRGRRHLGLFVGRLVFIQTAVLMSLGSRTEPPIYVAILTFAVTILAFPWRPTTWRRRRNWVFLVPLIIGLQSLAFLLTFSAEKVSERQAGAEVTLGPWQVVIDSAMAPLNNLVVPTLGWLDTPSPGLTRVLIVGAYAGAILVGLAMINGPKIGAVVFYLAASWGFVALALATASAPNQMQARYFLALLFGMVGLALLPTLGQRPTSPTMLQALLLAVALAVANLPALLWNSLRYVTGLEPATATAADLLEAPRPDWWLISPFDPAATWLLGSAAFLLAAIVGIFLTMSASAEKSPAAA